MTVYAAINKGTLAEVYRYTADAPVEWQGMEFATHDHIEVAEPVPVEVPINPADWHMTRRNFWNRFPANNEIAMRAVMNGNSPALLAAGLQRLRSRVDASPYVDLKLQETRDGVAWLASEAVPATVTIDGVMLPFRLTAAQATAILDVQPTEQEVYRG
jgi:hypothetical protein